MGSSVPSPGSPITASAAFESSIARLSGQSRMTTVADAEYVEVTVG
jgi:hypothetical protein